MNENYLKRMKEYLGCEYNAFLSSYNETPVRSLRVNKVSEEEIFKNLNIKLEKIPYDKSGYYVLDDGKYGNSVYHHLGAIYFQEPSAMMPVNTYNFRGDEVVLDLCASPGGKSSQILERIPEGILVSNEISNKRAKVLFGNLERMGFKNAIITNENPTNLAKTLPNFFDVILVDAPCSGEGMMRKDEDARKMWSQDNINLCALRDKDILDEAIKMLKKDGILIYSTCTFAKEEDEDIVNYLIDKYQMEILPTQDILKKYTKEGFVKETLRFYPHIARGEGQFMAVLKKMTETNGKYRVNKKEKRDKDEEVVYKFIKDNLNSCELNIVKRKNRFYHLSSNVDLGNLNVLNYGIELGEVVNGRFIPFHHFFKALGPYFNNVLELNINDKRVLSYLHGEEIKADVKNGYGVIKIGDLYLGGFKATNGVLKNHYPKGLRNQNLFEYND